MSIKVVGLTKSFGGLTALDNVSVTFEKGKIYGLLGRNGAGKTTLIRTVCGYAFGKSGCVTIDGSEKDFNGKTHAMFEDVFYPEGMRVKEAFSYGKDFYANFDKDFAEKTCEKFNLKLSKKIKSLSTGYKSIFKFIYAMATNADYVFLDEPVLGLDANHRDLLYKTLIEHFAEVGNSIIISTHLIDEVANIIENVVIIDNGAIIAETNKDELLSRGYSVSGVAEKVDKYVVGKKLLGESKVGGLKTAYVEGVLEEAPDGLEVSSLDLQQLFIQMTNEHKEKSL